MNTVLKDLVERLKTVRYEASRDEKLTVDEAIGFIEDVSELLFGDSAIERGFNYADVIDMLETLNKAYAKVEQK